MNSKNKNIQRWLVKRSDFVFSLYAIVAAFATYACMYAFRKPFTVGSFNGIDFFGLDYKTALVIIQVIGYTLSKFLGIKIISEMTATKRAAAILILIGIAELSLLLFAIVPEPYNALFMFFNGLPLGMVWGLVFSFLEGRKNTELLGAGLSVSFIVSSGFVKSIGKLIINEFNVTEFWMPFITGGVFIIPLIIFVWMLSKLPPPTETDEELRTKRAPMDKLERKNFFRKFASGIILLTVIYMVLTAFRDMRDNFMSDIWNELGYTDTPMIFTYTEIPIAVIVLIIMASLMLIKNNFKALLVNHYVVLSGIILVGISTFIFQAGLITAPVWMVLVGLGLYMGYVPFNCILFDRFIATYKTVANAGFLIYIADSFGYLSSSGVLLYKNFGHSNTGWFEFFINTSYVLFFLGGALTILSIIYFSKKLNSKSKMENNVAFSNVSSD